MAGGTGSASETAGRQGETQIPESLVRIARAFEGFSPRPYLCPAGFWTIGYGHLIPSEDYLEITREQAEALLLQDLGKAVAAAVRLCPVLILEPEQRLAAIADFTFNLGPGRLQISTLRRYVNDRIWDEAAHQIRRWVWAAGRRLPGLVRRREVEAKLLLLRPWDEIRPFLEV